MRNDLVLVVLLISILALMVIPLPAGLIDVLLTVNITLSVMLLMVAVYLKRPSDFSTFPAVILIATAFRLALSIATTRLILSEADAGQIIATFGEFVIRGSVVIGLVIFLIITVVQFVVVTKGAERVAEVAARFTLDAMPGKQMSIEADIRAGTLDQAEGSSKRQSLDKDSQFFGAMDGAMKFVKGDAIAGLVIIFINLLGGIAVGTSVHGYSLSDAISIYSLLTIGDGLVAQIPALLMSLCGGAIVTRVANESSTDLGNDIARELLSDPRVPAAAALIIFAFGFVPGFPFMVFMSVAGMLLVVSLFIRRTTKLMEDAAHREAEENADGSGADPADELIALPECGRIGLKMTSEASETLDLTALKIELAHRVIKFSNRYGVNIPRPFVELDDSLIDEAAFRIELDEVPIKSGNVPKDALLTTASQDHLRALGIEAIGKPIDWIDHTPPYVAVRKSSQRALDQAEIPSIGFEQALAEDLFRQQEQRIGFLFSKTETEAILDDAKKIDEAAVEEILAAQSKANLMMVFRYLIEDGVPLRPTRLLLESLSHWTHLHEDASPVFLAECLRRSMRRQMCQNLSGLDGEIGVAMLSPQLEERVMTALRMAQKAGGGEEVSGLPINPALSNLLRSEVRGLLDLDIQQGRRVVIVTAPELRRRLRDFLASVNLNFPVISPHELSDDVVTVPIKVLGEDLAMSTDLGDGAGRPAGVGSQQNVSLLKAAE